MDIPTQPFLLLCFGYAMLCSFLVAAKELPLYLWALPWLSGKGTEVTPQWVNRETPGNLVGAVACFGGLLDDALRPIGRLSLVIVSWEFVIPFSRESLFSLELSFLIGVILLSAGICHPAHHPQKMIAGTCTWSYAMHQRLESERAAGHS